MRIINRRSLIVLVLLVFGFSLPNFSEAAECRLVNVLTDKNQVGAGERIQVNITAQKECIGRTASVKICDSTRCAGIASQTFDSRDVNGQQAINPAVFFIVPSDFFNQNTSVFMEVAGPSNTVKSRSISIDVSDLGPARPDEPDRKGGNTDKKDKNVLGGFPGEDLEANDVINIVIGLSCWLTRVAFTLTIIFVIWVGFKFMAAQGNQTKYGEAVTSFKHVLWGVLVIYGAYVIIATVAHAVGASFSFVPLVC